LQINALKTYITDPIDYRTQQVTSAGKDVQRVDKFKFHRVGYNRAQTKQHNGHNDTTRD